MSDVTHGNTIYSTFSLILQQLRKANLTVKPQKCQLGMAECVYLGHIVGRGVVRPEISKVEAIQAFSQPTTKKQVRAFLGITGYYRKFISNYSTLAAPLTDLTKKNRPTKVAWTPECGLAFHELMTHLRSSPVLSSPNFSKPFIVQTDASYRSVGAVLSFSSTDFFKYSIVFIHYGSKSSKTGCTSYNN